MDQRPLRAGDSVDDYCPRERRVTSHAIVAVVDDIIRQTRCLTCDAEHEFKDGKMPRPRRKAPALAVPSAPIANGHGNGAVVEMAAPADPEPQPATMAAAPAVEDVLSAAPAHAEGNGATEDLWVGHRPLIRATLPRTEGDPPPAPRPIPEFTMHQRHGRSGQGFRGQWQDRNGNGNGNGPGGFRHDNGPGRGPQPPGPGGGRSRHRHRNKSRRSR